MIIPIVIHKDADSDYGATVPDLPGCFSAGETLDETLAMAKEAIELHMEWLITEKTVARLERNESAKPHGKTLQTLADRQGVSPDEIESF